MLIVRTDGFSLFTAALLTLVAQRGAAQTPPASFGELQNRLRVGAHVQVTSSDGRRTTGRLSGLTATSLEVQPKGIWAWHTRPIRRFGESDVTHVTRIDSAWNGGLIGFAAGFIPPVVVGCRKSDALDCGYGVFAGVGWGSLGALVGMVVDRMQNETVYRLAVATRTSVRVRPTITATAIGVSGQLRF